MKKQILYALIAFTFSSCSSTQLVFLTVNQPAPVTVPSHIKKAAILNRGESSRNRVVEVVDKIFSLEEARLDKEGALASITGITDELYKTNRFEEVITVDGVYPGSTVPGLFPAPLTWKEVEAICARYHTDALFSLEIFDTDSKISYTTSPVTINTPFGKIPGVEHTANMLTVVKTGWRMYDPASRIILDEFPMEKRINLYGKGVNPTAAAAAILGRKDAVKQAATNAGHQYAERILPYSLRVQRDYYVKATENFKTAKRKAQTGNWDGAASLWQKETSNTDPKVAGRACYNMAIISEINGNLDEAINWARKAYEQYNIRLGLQYVNILERRKINDALVNEQTAQQF
jgi:hypothetical protein